MVLKEDARKAVLDWIENMYGNRDEEADDVIPFCYSQYRYDDKTFVDEQWYADLEHIRIWCELGGFINDEDYEDLIVYEFNDYEQLVEFLDGEDDETLINEADFYIGNTQRR